MEAEALGPVLHDLAALSMLKYFQRVMPTPSVIVTPSCIIE
jgi:hypothetical protein